MSPEKFSALNADFEAMCRTEHERFVKRHMPKFRYPVWNPQFMPWDAIARVNELWHDHIDRIATAWWAKHNAKWIHSGSRCWVEV